MHHLSLLKIIELNIIKVAVQAALNQQLLMSTVLDDFAVVQYQYPVSTENSGQSMGNNERGASYHQPVESCLNYLLAFCIQRAGCLIQYENLRILQDCSGNSQTLTLTAGNIYTPLT